MKNNTDILIIGAGICGLFAARELSKKGKKVMLLEAMEQAGGRIRNVPGFSQMMDAGPEFIHGDLPLTKALIKEAGGKFHEQEGEFYQSKDGKIMESDELIEGWDEVMKKLSELKEDVTLAEFLSDYFPGEKYNSIKAAVTRLAEGFDAADANRISAFAVREEWAGDSIEESYQIEGGYTSVIRFLTEECKKNGCVFHFNTAVNAIDWEQELVKVQCANGQSFEAPQVLVTVSLGVLLTDENEKAHIRFSPGIPEKIAAVRKMGFGPVIKVNMEFGAAFWNNENYKDKATQLPDLRFLNSNTEFPAWWTKEPASPFLIGWVGGSAAAKMQHLSDEELLEKAITALSKAMNTPQELIRNLLIAHSVSNWGIEPFTKGAYSYQTPDTHKVKKVLAEPLMHKVYFAGEALGDNMGTVEAAMESAKKVLGLL